MRECIAFPERGIQVLQDDSDRGLSKVEIAGGDVAIGTEERIDDYVVEVGLVAIKDPDNAFRGRESEGIEEAEVGPVPLVCEAQEREYVLLVRARGWH